MLADDCILYIGQFSSLLSFSSFLCALGRTDLLSKEYIRIAAVLKTDIFPYHLRSWKDAFHSLSRKNKLAILIEVDDDDEILNMFLRQTNMDCHEEFDGMDTTIMHLLDEIGNIHPIMYSKIFQLRNETFPVILSMLLPDEMDKLTMLFSLPDVIQEQIFSYSWSYL